MLAQPVGYSPDFLTPAEPADGLDAGVAAVAATPAERLAAGSTSELATRVGISVACAGEHARVLHRTGLVTRRRAGGAVRHTISPLGAHLLSGHITD
ncbi:winged helix-turn-helix domain-containing protein [Kribbella rubisoli]|uniref:winged helix-turn-helix domain-containing protein n=1 Tax=Kribbella rubisoli TaxID=3075929 RepID=UPI00102C37D6|nr:winged helix-turn-helix domain-containing protein [Kribbella rubisoli]